MVDHESGGVPDALWSEASVITVAGDHEDIGFLHQRAHHLLFDPSARG